MPSKWVRSKTDQLKKNNLPPHFHYITLRVSIWQEIHPKWFVNTKKLGVLQDG